MTRKKKPGVFECVVVLVLAIIALMYTIMVILICMLIVEPMLLFVPFRLKYITEKKYNFKNKLRNYAWSWKGIIAGFKGVWNDR